ncbi:MAG TPA: 3-phosphoshikimate 1-carboxyvinyltransferase [bacterium]|nr:3-phosphoshikimate 1-carboxyvinyltransferase [bacterium]HOL47736.1 3-phosphoshikimate 1-carboxyvinyltransferase [bacterium]HPQ18030.1 3-phosphoshikimate 1-carboxyvinyltransferase [bacterium]
MKFYGKLKVLGDKSISHRSLILGGLSKGKLIIKNFLFSDDTLRTLNGIKKLNVKIKVNKNTDEIIVEGKGKNNLSLKAEKIYCGNSGTTARLLAGLLSGINGRCILTGDKSLSKRPMKRVAEPLKLMGANIKGDYLPLEIIGGKLKGINYKLPVASAQVKSAILLAGITASGKTSVIEPIKSRDHTERMIKYLEGKIKIEKNQITVYEDTDLFSDKELIVPNDISSAAFFIIGALLKKDSELILENITLNPTRTGLLEILKRMNANITIINKKILNNEPMGDILVKSSKLKGTIIKGSIIPKLIDEIPIIAIAALFAEGKTIIKDANELRVKETDRIKAIVNELSKVTEKIKEYEDGFEITGNNIKLQSNNFNSYEDHRIAMSLTILSAVLEKNFKIKNKDCVKISYPEFFNDLKKVLK